MYYLNKLIGFLINPVVASMLLGVASLVLRRFNRRRIAMYCGITAVVWLWFWMMPLTVRIVGAPLESEFLVDGRVPVVESFSEADAIVLLGGGMGAETNLSAYAEMFTSADRVWQAVRLYKAGKAKKILTTGFTPNESTVPLLCDFGVAAEDISHVIARNTEEEARAVAKMEYKKVLLVTSAWHMKRARLMFKKYAPNVEVVCAPADFENSYMAAQSFSLLELFPDPNYFMSNSVALHEWVGIIGYKLFR